jgi:hypothetical protein
MAGLVFQEIVCMGTDDAKGHFISLLSLRTNYLVVSKTFLSSLLFPTHALQSSFL